MTQRSDIISDERLQELIYLHKGLYGTIRGLTNNPQEFITVLSMLHLTVWLNEGDGSADEMLTIYCDNFRKNCALNAGMETQQ